VPGDLLGALGHAVEHDRQRRAAVAGGVQQVPGHRVGVAGGGRDEQPGVGGGEQLAGEVAVGLDDRVDVGRVEQREPLGQRVGRRELDPAGAGIRADRAGQAGEHAVGLEPAHVGGVADEHGRAGRRAQDARRRDGGADEAVDQRRLACAGRAADDHQQRRVHLAQAGRR
jgi:hypothetical protein